MIATQTFVRESFDRFNALCFDGILPAVPIVLTKAGTFLGKMEYKSRRDFFGIISSHYDFRLKISTGFDLPQEELEDVVIHEMIHYYIAYHNLRDSSVHGVTFRQIMQSINQEHGRHITVRHHCTPEQNLVSGRKEKCRKHYLCVSTFRDGKKGITVCATTKISELYRLLPKYYDICKTEWYCSTDPFFNRFPRSKTPKIYKITEEELAEHLKGSVAQYASDSRPRKYTSPEVRVIKYVKACWPGLNIDGGDPRCPLLSWQYDFGGDVNIPGFNNETW